MVDNIANLNVGSSGDLVTGNVLVDYTTNTVGGGLNLAVLGAQVPILNLALTSNGAGGYTVTGATAAGTGVALAYTGQTPATVGTTVTAVGVPAVTSTETVAIVCFLEGTMIRTPRGDVAIEHLAVGDLVVTSSGAHRPIKWLGHRTIECDHHPEPWAVSPIRIAAEAFGPNRPDRDLFVSPAHAICVDVLGEVLISAIALVNGATIARVQRDRATYWHVELDSHDIVVSNGLLTESYIDTGNRVFFVENGTVAFGAGPDGSPKSLGDYCRPLVDEGPLVELVRERLSARARSMGWALQEVPLTDVRIIADGVLVRPTVDGLSMRFILPADADDVWLESGTQVPAEIGAGPDVRALGVFLRSMTIDDGFASRDVALDDPLLCAGFHGLEPNGRWTTGRAWLSRALWQGCRDMIFLRLDLGRSLLPRWAPPAVADATTEPTRREDGSLDIAA